MDFKSWETGIINQILPNKGLAAASLTGEASRSPKSLGARGSAQHSVIQRERLGALGTRSGEASDAFA